jgi:xanthine dehydrogenase accessory factor
MDRQDHHVLQAARRWAGAGHSLSLVTVARTWGSSPRPPGSWMALRGDGAVQGSVSGGCVEADLIERVRAGAFRESGPDVLRYGVARDEADRFRLPCGGTLELVVEPSPDRAQLQRLEERIAAGARTLRILHLDGGLVELRDAGPGDALRWDGRRLATLHGPAWRLLIIGAGEVSRHLAAMAQALDYQVSVCDPRVEYAGEWDVPGAALVAGMPDDAVVAAALDPNCAVVALTHDPKLDDLALLEALKSPAFYVGALGSRLNTARRRERLCLHFDLTEDEVQRLHGPVGLPIGGRTPGEIAVSILAEMTAVRHGALDAAAQVLRAPTSAAA